MLCGFALAVSSVLFVGGCGCGSGQKTSSATQPSESSVDAMGPRPAETKASIRQAWEEFFAGSTSAEKRVSLLENGEQFAELATAATDSPLVKQAEARVSSVSLDGPTTATVTYSLLLGGTPILQDTKGSAVLADGTWKVGIGTFCKLLALLGIASQACPSAG